ncbi:hypothetical protein C8Q77DRAFT_1124804 [Trametes polyzona]|nr:hypothetical protein C8Q77DRAFT_1124804 [Trametes polyzona]
MRIAITSIRPQERSPSRRPWRHAAPAFALRCWWRRYRLAQGHRPVASARRTSQLTSPSEAEQAAYPNSGTQNPARSANRLARAHAHWESLRRPSVVPRRNQQTAPFQSWLAAARRGRPIRTDCLFGPHGVR